MSRNGGEPETPKGGKRSKKSATECPSSTILDEVWNSEYHNCPKFGGMWKKAMEGGDPWPEDLRIHRGKMYSKERLCVPTGLGERVVGAQRILEDTWVLRIL